MPCMPCEQVDILVQCGNVNFVIIIGTFLHNSAPKFGALIYVEHQPNLNDMSTNDESISIYQTERIDATT